MLRPMSTMRNRIRILRVAAVIVLMAPAVRAQPWEDLTRRVSPGEAVYVTDREGRVVHATLADVTTDGLVLSVLGDRYPVPIDRVARVERGGDRIWDGAAKGAAVGLLLWGATARSCPECVAAAAAGYGLMGGLLDWAHEGKTTIYRVPATRRVAVVPILSPRRAGVAAAGRW